MIITRTSDLRDLAGRLRARGSFALDMEFERERTYWPKLQLIQVGTADEAAVVDPLALEDLSPLWDLIADPAVEKVTHAGRQDAEIFFLKAGRPPRNVYDTQIAAALLGLGEQVGYSMLVQRILGVRLEKKERVTDWGRRPLTEAQIDYALNDVRYLPPIHQHLNEDLQALGRMQWLREELAFYEDRNHYEQDPDRLYLRVSRWRTLNRRGLGVLRELARWREEEAARRDVPRGRVVPDDVLVDIALRKPKRPADLRPLRRLHPREIERNGESIVAAVAAGMALSEAELPVPPSAPREDPTAAHAADLMGVLLRVRARDIKIAPSYLGTTRDMEALVSWLGAGREGPPPALASGWRGEAVGRDLAALYEGRILLQRDPETGEVLLLPSEDRS